MGANARALENGLFSQALPGLESVRWKDFEPLQTNLFKCISDRQLEKNPVCKQVQSKLQRQTVDAFLYAAILNDESRVPGKSFCNTYAQELISKNDASGIATYSYLLVADRIKYGSALYGSVLPNIYMGKLVFDALLSTSSCK
jgi:hypothetical protein